MARSAQEVLEFDKLRELLRLRTTCAPGRRAIDVLTFRRKRDALEQEFALIREARDWLEAASLLETSGWLRQQFREDAEMFPLLAAKAAAVGDFRDSLAAIHR